MLDKSIYLRKNFPVNLNANDIFVFLNKTYYNNFSFILSVILVFRIYFGCILFSIEVNVQHFKIYHFRM